MKKTRHTEEQIAYSPGQAGVSRAGFYRWWHAPPVDANLDLRYQIQRIALEFPSYGFPRMTVEL